MKYVTLALLMLGLCGCAVAPGVGVAAGIGAGVVGIVNNGRQAVRANIDARCQRWFSTEVGWFIAQRMSKGALDTTNFKTAQDQNNYFCLHAWRWPGKNADDMVSNNTDKVQNMIGGESDNSRLSKTSP